ncbi:hypothetical protein MY10362_003239 [Beauveria mimosiformis]
MSRSTDLAELGSHLLENGPRKVIPAPRRIRVIYNRTVIVDSTKGSLVWEHDYYPFLYFPASEIHNCTLRNRQPIKSDGIIRASVAELHVAADESRKIPAAVTDRVVRFTDDRGLGALTGLVRLEFKAMDQWLEEDVPIYVHPKDPSKRIEVLPSSRRIEVRVDGKTVAKSAFSMHLHEPRLPTRYYLPIGCLDQTVLRRSELVTKCPYKGDADYYDVVIGGVEYPNIVWYYRYPALECGALAGMACFYNEKVDILLDGQLLERPALPR